MEVNTHIAVTENTDLKKINIFCGRELQRPLSQEFQSQFVRKEVRSISRRDLQFSSNKLPTYYVTCTFKFQYQTKQHIITLHCLLFHTVMGSDTCSCKRRQCVTYARIKYSRVPCITYPSSTAEGICVTYVK